MFKHIRHSIRAILSDDIYVALDFTNENKKEPKVTGALLDLFCPLFLDLNELNIMRSDSHRAIRHVIPIHLNDTDTLLVSVAALITSSNTELVGKTIERIENANLNRTYAYMEDDISRKFDITFDSIKMALKIEDNEPLTIYSSKSKDNTYIVGDKFEKKGVNCSHHARLMRFELFASCFNAATPRRRVGMIKESEFLVSIVNVLPTKLRTRSDIYEILFKGMIDYSRMGFYVEDDLTIHYSHAVDARESPVHAMEFLRDNIELGYLTPGALIDTVKSRMQPEKFMRLSKIMEIE